MKLAVQNIKFTLAIGWAVLSCVQVQAQPFDSLLLEQNSTSNRRLNRPLIFAAPPPPSDIGEPGQRSEAGSRGCENIDKQLPTDAQKQRLTALVPVYSSSELVLGTTIASAPTFWFYIPDRPPLPAQFVLRDKDGKLVYQTDVVLPQTPGVVSLSLPNTAPPLLIDQPYRWFLKIYCQAQTPPAFVEGWIQRISLNPVLKSQLEKATPRDRVAFYAANGLWFEALSAAGVLRRRNPQDPSWAELLQAVGLNDLANEPIVECCTPR